MFSVRRRSSLPLLLAVILGAAACTERTPTEPFDPSLETAERLDAVTGTEGLTKISLGTLGGDETSAVGINARGQVVGFGTTAEGHARAFVWSAREGMRELPLLEGHVESRAFDINGSGVIVGWSGPSPFESETRAVRWLPNGEIVELESGTSAIAINNRGDIVGNRDVDFITLWPRGGSPEHVPCLRGFPSDIGPNDTIVGIASGAVGATVFFDGVTFEYTGFIFTRWDEVCRGIIDDSLFMMEPTGINARGQVVGGGGEWIALGVAVSELTADEPLLYTDRAGFTTRAGLPDRPQAINARGEVVGDGLTAINNRGDRVGGAYLWTSRPNAFKRGGGNR